MRIHVRYFAVLRDRSGIEDEVMDTSVVTVGELIDQLIATRSLNLGACLIRPAVNGAFVEPTYELQDDDEVLLIPPVAGG